MNTFQARLVLMCQGSARTTQEICNILRKQARNGLGNESTYNYVNKMLNALVSARLLVKKRPTKGKMVYYRAGKGARERVDAYMKELYDEESKKREEASRMMMNIKRLTEYV